MKINFLSIRIVMVLAWFALVGLSAPDKPDANKPQAAADKPLKRLESTLNGAQNLTKPLDLSVPFQGEPTADANDKTIQENADSLFESGTKKPSQSPLQLKGGWLMSPEPEAEKRKSLDGAGIVIQVKP
jgi:hypothetical protein